MKAATVTQKFLLRHCNNSPARASSPVEATGNNMGTASPELDAQPLTMISPNGFADCTNVITPPCIVPRSDVTGNAADAARRPADRISPASSTRAAVWITCKPRNLLPARGGQCRGGPASPQVTHSEVQLDSASLLASAKAPLF